MKINETTIIEIVLFRTNEGVNREEFNAEMKQWDGFLAQQKGFISREIAVSADGQYADITCWADLEAPKSAGEKADQNPKISALFDSNVKKIDPSTLSDEFFEVPNEHLPKTDKANLIEILRFKTKEGVNSKDLKAEMTKYRDFLLTNGEQVGFVSGQTGVSADGKYLNISYWCADLQSNEPATSEMEKFFSSINEKIDEKTLSDEFFEIISSTK
ncbi:MAG: hypothetical protein LBE57_03260 [Methanosarcinales archaeon]|jgi:hypothetical protein|nr:hypothetical protein [Methanosarcinales archaeon]